MEPRFYFLIGGGLIVLSSLYALIRGRRSEIEKIRGTYRPSLGWPLAYFRTKAAEKRNALLEQLDREELLVLEREHVEARRQHLWDEHNLAHEQTKRAYEISKRQSELMLEIIGWSKDRGVDTITYLKLQEAADHDRREMVKRWVEIQQDLRGGFILAQKEYQYLQMFREYINALYTERKLLEASDDPARTDKLKLLSGHIKQMEQDFNARQKRLRQAPSQKKLKGANPDSDFPGGVR
jgi:hypothetical protein